MEERPFINIKKQSEKALGYVLISDMPDDVKDFLKFAIDFYEDQLRRDTYAGLKYPRKGMPFSDKEISILKEDMFVKGVLMRRVEGDYDTEAYDKVEDVFGRPFKSILKKFKEMHK